MIVNAVEARLQEEKFEALGSGNSKLHYSNFDYNFDIVPCCPKKIKETQGRARLDNKDNSTGI